MNGRLLFAVVLAALPVCFSSGCAQMEATRKSMMMNDYVDGTEHPDDDWSQYGLEARAGRREDVEADGWFNNIFHTAKYRDVERSLGVRY